VIHGIVIDYAMSTLISLLLDSIEIPTSIRPSVQTPTSNEPSLIVSTGVFPHVEVESYTGVGVFVCAILSPPDQSCGIRAGDVILSLNGHLVTDAPTYRKVLVDNSHGSSIAIQVLQRKTHVVQPGTLHVLTSDGGRGAVVLRGGNKLRVNDVIHSCNGFTKHLMFRELGRWGARISKRGRVSVHPITTVRRLFVSRAYSVLVVHPTPLSYQPYSPP
jgi:hypothetical protein